MEPISRSGSGFVSGSGVSIGTWRKNRPRESRLARELAVMVYRNRVDSQIMYLLVLDTQIVAPFTYTIHASGGSRASRMSCGDHWLGWLGGWLDARVRARQLDEV